MRKFWQEPSFCPAPEDVHYQVHRLLRDGGWMGGGGGESVGRGASPQLLWPLV